MLTYNRSYSLIVQLSRGERTGTYPEEFVALLLIFSGHSSWCRPRQVTGEAEESKAGTETDGNAPGDTGISTGRVDGTGTVRTEGNVVSY